MCLSAYLISDILVVSLSRHTNIQTFKIHKHICYNVQIFLFIDPEETIRISRITYPAIGLFLSHALQFPDNTRETIDVGKNYDKNCEGRVAGTISAE